MIMMTLPKQIVFIRACNIFKSYFPCRSNQWKGSWNCNSI